MVEEAKRAEARAKRRKDLSRKIPFPFEVARRGQKELISFLEKGFEEKHPLMVQAPTGLGKTMGVLYPSLKESMARGQRTIYVTPKNSQQRVAEEAVEKFQEKGCGVKSLTLTSKSKLCMKAEPLCNPDYCEFAKDHYDKVHQHDLKAQLHKKKKITARVMKNFAEKYQVCPFELQLEAVQEVDTVICDYNYVFSARSALGKVNQICLDEIGKPNLIIDEAHNLPSRTMGYYSPALSSNVLEKMKEEMKLLPKKFAEEGGDLLAEAIGIITGYKPHSGKNEKIKLNLDPFLDMDEELKGFLSRYLGSDVEIKSRDVVLRFVFYWGEFIDILQQVVESSRPEFFTSYQQDYTGGTIKITCCDASELIRPRYEGYSQVVAFSATLKPFSYYAKLSGLESDRLKTEEFLSPFDHGRRKLLIIPQISTKYSAREGNYPRIAQTIERVVELRHGNYIAFFPSFDFLEKTASQLKLPFGTRFMKQSRTMKNTDVDLVIEEMKVSRNTLLFAVQGGHFSEGVDYPGDMLIGAFVVGPPLPNFDFERETMKDFYQQHYQRGFDYAYTYPAMAKAVQSAGRVIRTENDKGIIILMDERFLETSYSKSMPQDWFSEKPQELVSSSILQDLRSFWERT